MNMYQKTEMQQNIEPWKWEMQRPSKSNTHIKWAFIIIF